jgi:EAL domain-containing protein (putative c-di-GMP-specific phosphodiesterase class I)
MSEVNDETLETELRNAIKNDELILYYQPQYNLVTLNFEGVEALIRWMHPQRGLLMPDEFIHAAEKSELIILIGEWVLRKACNQIKAWQQKGLTQVHVAVNVSGQHIKQKNFVDFVIEILQETQLDPTFLELELNENLVIHEDDELTIQMIHRLKNLGILISLDDFGTGNIGIKDLQTIPADRIKLDKTFIENINHNSNDAKIVQSLIVLAAKLNLQIVAEGVETLFQLKKLLAQECNIVQGNYFSEPLPADEVEKFLLNYQKLK